MSPAAKDRLIKFSLVVIAALLAFAQAFWQGALSLLAVFPFGANEKVDLVVEALRWVRGAGIAIFLVGALVSALYWRRDRGPFGAILGLSALALVGPPQALLLFAILSAQLRRSAFSQETGHSTFWGEIGVASLAALGASFTLMTLATPFPHQMQLQDMLYMSGNAGILSTVLIASLVLLLFLGRLGLQRYARREATSRSASWLAFGAKLAFLMVVYWFVAGKLYGVVSRLDSSFDYWPLASYGSVAVTLVLLSLLDESGGRMELRIWGPWAFLLILAIRSLFGWYKGADKDIPTVMAGDVINLIVPLIVVVMGLSLASRARLFLDYHRLPTLWLAGAIALLSWFAINQDSAAWVNHVENNRPFAAYVSEAKRTIMDAIGLGSNRPSRELYFALENLAADATPTLSQTPDQLGALVSQSAAGEAPKGPLPHIFIFVSDATSRVRMGAYGYERANTPNLSAFAEHARVFDRHYSTASDTLQNVLSIYSGQYIGRKTWLDNKQRTRLCELLSSLGYRMFIAGGMRPYGVGSDDSFCASAHPLSFFGNESGDYIRIAASLKAAPTVPHFVYIHVHGGHNPWHVDPTDAVYGTNPLDVYDAMVRVADRQFGEMLKLIDEQGVDSTSLVIFTADHGIGFGDHFDLCSYSHVRASNINVPFAMRGPGISPGRIDRVTSHLDVLPTLQGYLLGTGARGLQGRSMLSEPEAFEQNRCVFAAAAYNDAYSMQCQDGRKLLVNRQQKSLELYDTNKDPRELNNLVDQWTVDDLATSARPMIEFLARGSKTYALRLQ